MHGLSDSVCPFFFFFFFKKTTGLSLFTVSRKTGSGFAPWKEASPVSAEGAGTRSAGGMDSLSSADRLLHQMVRKKITYKRLAAAADAFKCSYGNPASEHPSWKRSLGGGQLFFFLWRKS